jgi:hypothetical protein
VEIAETELRRLRSAGWDEQSRAHAIHEQARQVGKDRHCIFLSHPKEVAALIEKAAKAAERAQSVLQTNADLGA